MVRFLSVLPIVLGITGIVLAGVGIAGLCGVFDGPYVDLLTVDADVKSFDALQGQELTVPFTFVNHSKERARIVGANFG